MEIAAKLGAKTWFSTHDDGNKISGGFLTKFLRTTRFRRDDIQNQLSSTEPTLKSTTSVRKCSSGVGPKTTEVFALAIGETVTVSSNGIHDQITQITQEPNPQIPERRTRHRRGESWLDLDEEEPKEPPLELSRGTSSCFANLEVVPTRFPV
jgi:hypothetical protein